MFEFLRYKWINFTSIQFKKDFYLLQGIRISILPNAHIVQLDKLL